MFFVQGKKKMCIWEGVWLSSGLSAQAASVHRSSSISGWEESVVVFADGCLCTKVVFDTGWTIFSIQVNVSPFIPRFQCGLVGPRSSDV